MAQSTTIINAKVLYASVAAQDVSGSLQKADITVDAENAQHYTADGDFAFALVGKRRWAGVLTGYYSETANEFYDEVVTAFEAGTATAIVVSADGNDIGDEALSGNVRFTQMPYSFDSSSADAIMLAVPFIGDGTLARADVT